MNKFLSLLIATSIIYSQGMFVNDNGNYIGIQGNYETETESGGKTTWMSGGVSYLMQGNIELGVSYQRGAFDSDYGSDDDFALNVVGGSATYYIKNIAPVNMAIGAGYNTLSADADWLDDIGVEMTGTNFLFGGGIYATILEAPNYSLTPSVSYTINNTNMKITDGIDEIEQKDTINAIVISLGIKMGQFIITPQISMIDGENDFGLNFGLILPAN